MATYKTRSQQTVYDLAIQLYGDLSKIGEVIKLFPNLDDSVTLGEEIEVEEQTDPQAVFFQDRGIIVSTDIDTSSYEVFDDTFDLTFR